MNTENRITCIITDDEPFARKGLQGYIENIPFLSLEAVCENAIELNAQLQKTPVDLLFLDIEMPYISGIAFLKSLSKPPKVIFTTAYEQYAIQGFELEVVDYLLKPISFERFLKAANKVYEIFRAAQQNTEPDEYFFVKSDIRLERIAFADILFAEALENYVAIYTAEKKIIAHLTLKMLVEKLQEPAFIQPHKSYVVAVKHIRSIEGNLLQIDKYNIPISKYQKETVMEKIVNNKLLKR